MGPKTTLLVAVLEELIQLLDSDGQERWSNRMRRSKERILALDYSGIEDLLRAYGGMGSFNDLIICQTPDQSRKAEHQEKNDKLNELRSRAWGLAEEIRRSQSSK